MLVIVAEECGPHNAVESECSNKCETIQSVVSHLCLKLRCAGGREFDPRPGQYSRMRFFLSDQVTGTVFSHLKMPFLPNSEFI